MRVYKAGDCLSYAIGNELLEFSFGENMIAFVSYFVLKGFLDRNITDDVNQILSEVTDSDEEKKQQFLKLSKILVEGLKRKITFHNFDELHNELNKIMIPEWIFDNQQMVWKMFPQVFLVRDLIYYLVKGDEGRVYFRCIHVKKLRGAFDVDADFWSEDEEFPFEETSRTISTKYAKILGFNEATMTFYLEFRYTNSLYAEYRLETNQEVIHHYHCYGIADNKFPVIRDGDKVSVVVRNKKIPIKEVVGCENYEIKEKHIYVSPTYGAMFRPYRMLFSGERVEISYAEAVKYILENIRRDAFDFSIKGFFWEKENNFMEQEDITLSLEYLENFLKEQYDLEENKEARIYYFIVQILKQYLPVEQDILDYFFLLGEVSKKMDEYYNFLGEKIYWRLNELSLSGVLEENIKRLDQLRTVLLEDISDEDIPTEDEEYVGYFQFDNTGKMNWHRVKTDEAICIGKMLLPEGGDGKKGIVAYDIENGIYEIRYNRMLEKNEIREILAKFQINRIPYSISVDKKKEIN